MPAVPQILKVITFTLDVGGGSPDPEDFSLDVVDVSVVPAPGAVQTVKTLDGTTHQDAESPTWALQGTAVIDWDTTRPGLASYLYTNDGATAVFELRKNESAISTSNPEIQGTVTIVPIQYGGPGNEFAEAEVSMPIDGTIVVDVTP